jgi:quercetin dioxygenase-like cupin family protein
VRRPVPSGSGGNVPVVLRKTLIAMLAASALVAAGAGGYAIAGEQQTAVREALAGTDNAIGAPGKTLGLSRVTIPPGVRLALHRHAGTQAAYIDQGTLTYTVRVGEVRVAKGPFDAKHKIVRVIRAGQTGQIASGQWIVEQPNVIHFAENRGTKPVVIYLSTLFPIGAPPSIPVDG